MEAFPRAVRRRPVKPGKGGGRAGASTLALFVSLIYVWLVYGTGWTCFLGIALLPLTGIASTAQVLQMSWGNQLSIMVLAMILLSYGLNKPEAELKDVCEVEVIGNALEPRKANYAVREGFLAGMNA